MDQTELYPGAQPDNVDVPTPADKPAQSRSVNKEALNRGRDKQDIKPQWNVEGKDEPSTFGLHPRLVDFIHLAQEQHDAPLEFVMAPFIAAISIAAGPRIKVKAARYTNLLNVCTLSIGESGTNKSGPPSDMFAPLESFNDDLIRRYLADVAEYNRKKLTKESTKQSSKEDPNEDAGAQAPIQRQIIVGDITEEARNSLLANNPLLQYNDEFTSFLSNLGKYTKTNEKGTVMSLISNKTTTVNRLTREPVSIKTPFLSLFGTIQTETIIPGMINKEDYICGFTPRFIFFYTKDANYEYSDKEENPRYIEYKGYWDSWLNTLLRNSQEYILTPCSKAKRLHAEFMSECAAIQKQSSSGEERSVVSKMKINVWRLAGIAHAINNTVDNHFTTEITGEEMDWAISIMKYNYRKHMALLRDAKLVDVDEPVNKEKAIKDAAMALIEHMPDLNVSALAEMIGKPRTTVSSWKKSIALSKSKLSSQK